MLFNSYEFIFFFLPVVFFSFFWIARKSFLLASLWLATASLFFYGWWNPKFVLLLLTSIMFNYSMGYAIGHVRLSSQHGMLAKWILVTAITSNLALLCYFKYTNFFINTANYLAGMDWGLANIFLPLGISFFTFTQVAFLVDVYRGVAREYNFIHYMLFVTYFPHLIAGPVLHHKQMMPQFEHADTYKFNSVNVNIGLTIFTIGLFKKVFLADQIALYANPVFDAAAHGGQLQLLEAWIGAIAYALQLYFDFSGYSDMAIGLSRMFNVVLPFNFNSPYKATNIIEFWRRWHMTLSTFLRDYLYIPLGGNRQGVLRRYANLMITMLLGGLWHGANWTFVIWGGLHGFYLVINHGWQTLSRQLKFPKISGGAYWARSLTFSAVVIAWVPFRANDTDTAIRMLRSMAGLNGVSLSGFFDRHFHWVTAYGISFNGILPVTGLPILEVVTWLTFGLAVVWMLPNMQQFWSEQGAGGNGSIESSGWKRWQLSRPISVLIGAMLGISILGITRASQFLYFQF